MANLATNAFYNDVQQLVNDANKRKIAPVKEALEKCLHQRCNDTAELWSALLLGVDSFPRHSKSTLSCISNLGKLATLQLVSIDALPFACSVLRRLVANGVDHVTAGSASNGAAPPTPNQSSVASSASSAASYATAAALSVAAMGAAMVGASTGGGSGGGKADAHAKDEEEFQLRTVQTIISFVSACEVQKCWIEEPLSFIFYLFCFAKSPIVQAACSATVSQTCHSMLQSLVQTSTDDTVLANQTTAAACFRDICSLIGGNVSSWLKLQPHEGGSNLTSSASGRFVVPHTLRILLVDVLTSHFTSFGSSPLKEASPLYIQTLNEDFVALMVSDAGLVSSTRASSPSPDFEGRGGSTDGVTSALRATSPPPSGAEASASQIELYTKLTKLCLAALTSALPVMRNTAHTLIQHHLDVLCAAAPVGTMSLSVSGRSPTPSELRDQVLATSSSDAWRVAVLVPLWRKTLSDHSFLGELLDNDCKLGRARSGAPEGSTESVIYTATVDEVQALPVVRLMLAISELLLGAIQSEQSRFPAHDDVDPLEDTATFSVSNSSMAESSAQMHPALKGDIAPSPSGNLLARRQQQQQQLNESARKSSLLSLDRSGSPVPNAPSPPSSHPLLAHIPAMVEFNAIASQSLCRLLESGNLAQAKRDGDKAEKQPSEEKRAVGLAGELASILLPKLRRSCVAALDVPDADDALHAVLKTLTHIVHAACLAGIPQQRDAALFVLQAKLLLQRDGTSPTSANNSPSLARPVTSRRSPSPAGALSPPVRMGSPGQQQAGVSPIPTHESDVRRRLHVMSTIASIASGMGNLLDGGWPIVLKCFVAFSTAGISDEEAAAAGVSHDKKALLEAIRQVFETSAILTLESLKTVARALAQALANPVDRLRKLQSSPDSTSSGPAHAVVFGGDCVAALCRSNISRIPVVWQFVGPFWVDAAAASPHCPPQVVERLGEVLLSILTDPPSPPSGGASKKPETPEAAQQESATFDPFDTVRSMYQSSKSQVCCGLILRELHRVVGQAAQRIPSISWASILKLLQAAPRRAVAVRRDTTGSSSDASALLTAAYDDVSFAFRTVEMLQHSCITLLGADGLLAMVTCVGEFIHLGGADESSGEGEPQHSSQPGVTDRGINTSLSAVQLVWSMADFLVAASGVNADPLHWNTLMLQLRDGCFDTRHEVRQSSLKTVSSLVITHGALLPTACWGTCAWDVLLAICEHLEKAIHATFAVDQKHADPNAAAAGRKSPVPAAVDLDDAEVRRLRRWATAKQLSEMSCAVIEAVGRIMRLFYESLENHVPKFIDVRARLVAFCCAMISVEPGSSNSEDLVNAGVRVIDGLFTGFAATAGGNQANKSSHLQTDIGTLFGALETLALSSACNAVTLDTDTGARVAAPPEAFKPTTGLHEANKSTKVMTAAVGALGNAVAALPHGERRQAFLYRALAAFERALESHACVASYTFPAAVQSQVFEEVNKLIVNLAKSGSQHPPAEGDWQSATRLLLSQVPSVATTQRAIDDSAKSGKLRALKDAAPKHLNPRYLVKLVEYIRDVLLPAMPPHVSASVAPQVIRAFGGLLEARPLVLRACTTYSLDKASLISALAQEQLFTLVPTALVAVTKTYGIGDSDASKTLSADARRASAAAVNATLASALTAAEETGDGAAVKDAQVVMGLVERNVFTLLRVHADVETAGSGLHALVTGTALANPATQSLIDHACDVLQRVCEGEGLLDENPSADEKARAHELQVIAKATMGTRLELLVGRYVMLWASSPGAEPPATGERAEVEKALLRTLGSVTHGANTTNSEDAKGVAAQGELLGVLVRLISVGSLAIRTETQAAMTSILGILGIPTQKA